MKLIIDNVLADKNVRLLNRMVLLLLGIQMAKLVFSFLTSYLFGVFGQKTLTHMKRDFFHKMIQLPLSFFDKNQTGYLVSRIGEVENLNFFFSSTTVRVLIGFLEFIFSLAILIHLNLKLTLIAIFVLPLILAATRFKSKELRETSREVMEKGASLARKMQDTLSGVDVVKVFAAEERETVQVNTFLEDYKKANIKRTVMFTFSSELLTLIGAAGGLIVLWYSGWDIIRGNFTLGSYVAFAGYMAKLYGPTQLMANIGLSFQPAFTALQRVSELMELEEEDKAGARLEKVDGRIEFRNVSFAYGSKPALRDVSFRFGPREKVLITGPNGSGKSTMVKLILGLYRAQKGEILIDGQRIESVSLSSLRGNISIVSQNTFLFNDTIRNNILYSQPDASQARVELAAELSGSAEFIRKLEGGYETMVGETGKLLSGGEKQKISIARAILRDRDIVIFDEAVTHLDLEAERKVMGLLNRQFQNKTCLVISHCKELVSNVDRVIEFREGKVESNGPGRM